MTTSLDYVTLTLERHARATDQPKYLHKPMQTLNLFNGNGQAMTKDLPKLIIVGRLNDVALARVAQNTDLMFTDIGWGYEAQPVAADQIARLLLTYNFKTRYYDNWSYKNTLMLKNDHHIGYDVDHICYNCVKANHIVSNGLKSGDRLAC